MNQKREMITTLLLVFMFMLGLSLMLYPTFSNWWNDRVQSKVIADYDRVVSQMDESQVQMYLAQAEAYNASLAALRDPYGQCDTISGYDVTLDITGTGVMGYITISKINVHLPIYHGTTPEVLNVAVGHLEGSSLPIGGIGRHAVLSAHRGLPSAKLFTDLDKLEEEDTFTITILDEILTYEVDNIQVVLPHETELIWNNPETDRVTLVTCTPYGINTHRLLVQAHRIAQAEEHETRVPADAVQTDVMTAYTIVIIPVLLLVVLYWAFSEKWVRERFVDPDIADKLPTGKER